MGLFVYFFQFFEGCVGVYFGCRQTFVPQQFFHGFDVGVVVQHCGCEGVAQNVRRAFFYRSDERELFFYYCSHFRACQPVAFCGYEKCVLCVVAVYVVTPYYILPQFVAQVLSERDDSLLVAFSRHFYGA